MDSTRTMAALFVAVIPTASAYAADMLDADLAQWNRLGDANWTFTDGVVAADSGGGFLVSKEAYGNFELTLEFYPGADSNSGVFMRCANPAEITDQTCYEANIFDKRPDQTGRTGGIPNVAQPTASIDTEGQWNTYQITMDGTHITIRLEDVITVDIEDDKLASGPIALQYAAGSIKFRNVQIRKL
jgi:hypothetical protein